MTAAPRAIAAIASPRSARSRRAASEVPPASATAAASTSGASPGSPTTPVLTTTARWPRATMMSRTSRASSDLVSSAANSAILCPAAAGALVAFMAHRPSFRGRPSRGGAGPAYCAGPHCTSAQWPPCLPPVLTHRGGEHGRPLAAPKPSSSRSAGGTIGGAYPLPTSCPTSTR